MFSAAQRLRYAPAGHGWERKRLGNGKLPKFRKCLKNAPRTRQSSARCVGRLFVKLHHFGLYMNHVH